MKNVMLGVWVLVLALGALWACGEESDSEWIPRTVLVKVGGCHMENKTPNLRVGVFAEDAQNVLVELASITIDTSSLEHQPLLLDAEPPEDVIWVVEGDGKTRRTQLLVLAYVDADESSTYSEDEDGGTVGSAAKPIFFFDQSYAEKNAVHGFNLPASGGGYTQDFSGNPMFIPAGGCD